MTQITLTETEWRDKYRPILNPIDNSHGYDGCLFETYGDERDFVIKHWEKHPNQIWTLMDDGSITNGYHYVNRAGYFICQEDANGAIFYTVNDWSEEDDDG